MEPNEIFGLINFTVAIVVIGFSIPLLMRRIKMNHLYGVRIKKSFESEEHWYKINEYGGKQFIIWSLPMLLAGLLCFFLPISEENKDILSLIMGVGPITVCSSIAVINIVVFVKKL